MLSLENIHKMLLDTLITNKNTPLVVSYFNTWQHLSTYFVIEKKSEEDKFNQFCIETAVALELRILAFLYIEGNQIVYDYNRWEEVVSGDYYRAKGISNFFDPDIYSWIVQLLDIRTLSNICGSISEQIIKKNNINMRKSNWIPYQSVFMVQKITDAENSYKLPIDFSSSILVNEDSDGSKTRAVVSEVGTTGLSCLLDPYDILFFQLNSILVAANAPLSYLYCKLAFLLTIDRELLQYNIWIHVPVYLMPENELTYLNCEKELSIMDTPEFPSNVSENLILMDWILFRMEQYIKAAELRMIKGYDEDVVISVCGAFYDYLIANKPKTPVPAGLNTGEADQIVEVLRFFIDMKCCEHSFLPLDLYKCICASKTVAKLKFDKVI
ncbi:MAG TPA: hypothetical protein DEZ08_01315 [Dehalococcoidia bacterium]|jgi:hypothetical protein|nr:hypothetical protein [Dehalococcoidia bacterium]